MYMLRKFSTGGISNVPLYLFTEMNINMNLLSSCPMLGGDFQCTIIVFECLLYFYNLLIEAFTFLRNMSF